VLFQHITVAFTDLRKGFVHKEQLYKMFEQLRFAVETVRYMFETLR